MPTAPRQYKANAIESLRGTRTQRGYDYAWLKLSAERRKQYPVCEYCNDALSVDTDHVQPFRSINDPLRLMWSNLRATCRNCHQKKTHGSR